MIEFLGNIDTYVFYLINVGISNPVFDKIMPFITDINNWILVYIFLFSWLFLKGGKNGMLAVLLLIFTITISDQISSSVLKEMFDRIRPCHTLSDINLLVNCGSGKSMPSSHAVNSFALATIVSYLFRQYRYFFYIIASMVAFSRVYVGVHYPSDIVAGAAIGFLIANILISLNQRTIKIKGFH